MPNERNIQALKNQDKAAEALEAAKSPVEAMADKTARLTVEVDAGKTTVNDAREQCGLPAKPEFEQAIRDMRRGFDETVARASEQAAKISEIAETQPIWHEYAKAALTGLLSHHGMTADNSTLWINAKAHADKMLQAYQDRCNAAEG